MRCIIRRGNQILGTLFFDDTIHHFDGDPSFNVELAAMVRKGIPAQFSDQSEDSCAIYQETVFADDKRFPLALLSHLRNRGFGVEEILQDVENRFKKYMSLIPHDTALHRDATAQWTILSYLEKTYLLDIIEKDKIFT